MGKYGWWIKFRGEGRLQLPELWEDANEQVESFFVFIQKDNTHTHTHARTHKQNNTETLRARL